MTTKWRKVLLMGGILASLVYAGTDILAGILYPGYSFTAQAVSELFAIGAPTSYLVVPLFTLSSLLLAAFVSGVWSSSGRNRAQRVKAIMILGNAINSLVLWNFFPMHMRGVEQTFTDTMHMILAVNPFILLSIGLGVAAFRNWFRFFLHKRMQGLPRLPTLPQVGPLLRRKLPPSRLRHKHHLWRKDLYQVVLQRPSEPTRLIRSWRDEP